MKDLFLSYASKGKKQATLFVQALEKEGWSIWWDRRLLGGEEFSLKIQSELEKSRCVIVLWSKISVASRWVKAECSAAANKGKTIIPVFLEKVEPPLEFNQLNAIDLVGWDDSRNNPEFKRLLDSLASKFGNSQQLKGNGTPKQPELEISRGDSDLESLEDNTSSHDSENKILLHEPILASTILNRFILLPFGIPFLMLLLSHLLIREFG